jgi:heptosyltransferase-2
MLSLSGLGRPRIAIVRAGALGDTILLLPALGLVRRALSHAEITLVGSTWAEKLASLLGQPWKFVPFDSQLTAPLFGADASDDPTGAFHHSDLVINYTSARTSAFARNIRRLCRGAVIEWPVTPAPGMHAACHFAAAVSAGVPAVEELPFPSLRVGPDARERAALWIAQHFKDASGQLAVVHPGSGSERKCWPAPMFAQLASGLAGLGMHVALLKGPADEQCCSAVAASLSNGEDVAVAGTDDIQHAAALVSCATVFVGNDSGMSHLAAALGTPSVAIFGPTDPSVWGPLGRSVAVVQGAQKGRKRAAWPPLEAVLNAVRAQAGITAS